MTGTPESGGKPAGVHPLDSVASKAWSIYEEQFKGRYEKEYLGLYVAIDVISGKAYPHETSAGALQDARRDEPHGLFHIIRVGAKQAFRITRSAGQPVYADWPA